MRYFFSKTQRGFFIEGISPIIPEDSVEITEERYRELFEQQSNGKQIKPDENGNPILVDRLDWPDEMVAKFIRDQRDALLKESDWTQLPDIPNAIKNSWAIYRQQLRDVPQQEGFPSDVIWPVKPF